MNKKLKSEIESRLNSIVADLNSHDTIKLLLIEIREYIPGDTLTKEISHFVAHPDRDRGIIHGSITYFYCQICVFLRRAEWLSNFNASSIPFEVFQVIKGYYTYVSENPSFVDSISKIYKFDKQNRTYNLIGQIKEKHKPLIGKAIGVISANPVISGDKMVSDLCRSLKVIGLGQYEQNILSIKDSIILCLLIILHRSNFGLVEGKTGKAFLDLGYSQNSNLEYLSLTALVPIDGSNSSAGYSLIETNLDKSYLSQNILNNHLNQNHLDLSDLNLKLGKENNRLVIDIMK